MARASTVQIGLHRAWFEPPDVFVTHWHGEVTASDMHSMYESMERVVPANVTIYALNIVGDAPTVGAEARKVAAQDPRGKRIRFMAMVGASFHVRVVATMMIKASALVYRKDDMVVTFFDTEQEGRKWLGQQREKQNGIRGV